MEKIFQLWREEKRDQAASLLLDLLVLQGWTQENWEKSSPELQSRKLRREVPEVGDEAASPLEEIIAFCQSRGLGPSQHRSGERTRLSELVDQGLPPWVVLVLIAPHVDRRTRLYRKLEEKGAVLDLGLERDRSGKVRRESIAEFVDHHIRAAGKRIDSKTREAIVRRAGDELWAVHQELEKLILYIQNERIPLKDVEEVFLDRGEAWVFDLTATIAQRDPLESLLLLRRLLSQGEHPLRLLATVATEIRKMLKARQMIDGELSQGWRRGMSFPEFQQQVVGSRDSILTRSAYGDYKTFQRADNFGLEELLRYLNLVCRCDIRLKSSGASPCSVLERLILEMCQGRRNLDPDHASS